MENEYLIPLTFGTLCGFCLVAMLWLTRIERRLKAARKSATAEPEAPQRSAE